MFETEMFKKYNLKENEKHWLDPNDPRYKGLMMRLLICELQELNESIKQFSKGNVKNDDSNTAPKQNTSKVKKAN